MRGMIAIWQRELKAYFVSPIFYAVSTVFLVIMGLLFYFNVAGYLQYFMQAAQYPPMMERININEMILRPLFSAMSFVAVLILMPMLTMRLFAEEKKTGTIELILTSPVKDWQVIVGKFFAVLSLYAIMMALTLIYPLILTMYGQPDWAPIWLGYLGLLFMGAGVLTIGLFASSLTENQIVAAVICFGAALLLWLFDGTADLVSGRWRELFSYLSVLRHYENFSKGVLDSTDVLFYLSFICFGLFITVRSLESTRWRQ
ncbi:MAG: ABC transporter permease subunit [Candidatus Latescibacteria bacterium]|nr:ABC transporter permease subunit [Candidatus Latescibacterota bacterium]